MKYWIIREKTGANPTHDHQEHYFHLDGRGYSREQVVEEFAIQEAISLGHNIDPDTEALATERGRAVAARIESEHMAVDAPHLWEPRDDMRDAEILLP